MDILKKLFPLSFDAKDVAGLVIRIIIYLAASIVIGFIIALFAFVPIINLLMSLVGSLCELYVVSGIVITILDYLKVFNQ